MLNRKNVEDLELEWSYTTGLWVVSSAAVVDGVVYFGSGDYNVYALSADSGAKLWSYATGSYVLSSPAVANGVVYVGSNDGHLYALNAMSGEQLWSYNTGGVINSDPLVANGVVYIGGGNYLYALKALTGAVLWSAAVGTPSQSPTVAEANGVIYVGSYDGHLYALVDGHRGRVSTPRPSGPF